MEQKINITPQGNELIIREGNATSVFEYKGFQYDAFSTDSFVRLLQAKANPKKCVVAYDNSGMHAIVDDTVTDRKQDHIGYEFRHSLQCKEWRPFITGASIGQRDFIKFLQRRDAKEIENGEALLYALKNFKYVTSIEGDFGQIDDHNYTFAFKTKEGEGTVKIPQTIVVNMEIFNESEFVQPVEIEIEVYKPKEAGEAPGFRLECPKFPKYEQEAAKHEIEKMKEGLEGYLIITGSI